MIGWLCRATCCSVESTPMLGVSHAVQNKNSGSLHRVIGEVLVPGLLVVVYKIANSSFMFNTAAGVLEPGKI